MSDDENGTRGDPEQPEHLVKALRHVGSAIACHDAGMSDPALADVDRAMAELESYREGRLLMRHETEDDKDE